MGVAKMFGAIGLPVANTVQSWLERVPNAPNRVNRVPSLAVGMRLATTGSHIEAISNKIQSGVWMSFAVIQPNVEIAD